MGSGKKRWVVLMVLLVSAASLELGWCWGDAMANAKERLNIATNWAQDKFAGGGVNKETTERVKEKTSGAAGAMNTAAASDTSKYASDNGDGRSRSRSLEEEEDAKLDDLKSSYDDAMKKMGDSYNSAKDTISEHSKHTYEAAKDHTHNTYEAAKEMAQNAAAKID